MKFKILALLLIPLSIFLISSTVVLESETIENIESTEMLDFIKEAFEFDELLDASIVKEGNQELLFVRGMTNGIITTATKNISMTGGDIRCNCNHSNPKYRGKKWTKGNTIAICIPCDVVFPG